MESSSQPTLSSADSQYLSIVLMGMTGDVAKRMVVPGLFALFVDDILRRDQFHIIGFARSDLNLDEFRETVSKNLPEEFQQKRDEFFKNISYVKAKDYDDAASYRDLNSQLEKIETSGNGKRCNRLVHLGLPPEAFLDAVKMLGDHCRSKNGWTRIMLEKPFAHSLAELNELISCINRSQFDGSRDVFWCSHFGGKHSVSSVSVLRQQNPCVLEKLFSYGSEAIQSIQIVLSETLGAEGRKFFDQYGIVRDVMVVHQLLEMLVPFCSELPVNSDSKLALLRAIRVVEPEDIIFAQYTEGGDLPAYRKDKAVKNDSNTPTFSACALHIDTDRWRNVPILMKAGKGLDKNTTELHVVFHDGNRFIVKYEEDEFLLTVKNLVPGVHESDELQESVFKLSASSSQQRPKGHIGKSNADAYANLFFRCIQNDKSYFLNQEQAQRAWEIFDNVLKKFDAGDRKLQLEFYPARSDGPQSQHALAKKYNTKWYL